ncbi:hypothetical protein DCC35_03560 [Mangrovivirga cuniculi]|uniref:Uncharacterized protein n=1 Tax=Mangrovivirga cuniculi TaxID=2715131 RepID=A0A4D7JQR4_9BACT|nr:hypothetical protein DCC35_03560 [Mangrovivirga cuniculi]
MESVTKLNLSNFNSCP